RIRSGGHCTKVGGVLSKTVTTVLASVQHPPALVTRTLYPVVVSGLTVNVGVVASPGNQKKVASGPASWVAVKTTGVPGQVVIELRVTTGGAWTSILAGLLITKPHELFTTTS